MKNLVAALLIACFLAACGMSEPHLESFSWSRDSYPPPGFSQYDEPIPAPAADRRVINVWSTTYARQDMSKAKGWLTTTPSEVVLCFSAPDYPPNTPALGVSDVADIAAAYPTLLVYELGGSDYTSNMRFGGACSGR